MQTINFIQIFKKIVENRFRLMLHLRLNVFDLFHLFHYVCFISLTLCMSTSNVCPVTNESDVEDSHGGGLRRACSLSDLSKPSLRRILPSPPNNGIVFILRP